MDRYKVEIIVNGYCKSIVAASLSNGKIIYSLEEYERVSGDMNVLQSLKFLKGVVEVIEDLEDHLLFQGEYELSLDRFWYSRRSERYLIAYKEGEGGLLDLISQIKPNDYLISIRDEIRRNNPSNKRLAEIIENKLQEAYHCEIY